MKDHVILALVLPAASCLDRAVVVPVSSVPVLPCGGVDRLPPALEVERVVLLIKLHAVFLPMVLFLYSAQSNLSLLVSTVIHLDCTAPPMKCFGGVSFTRLF